MVAFGYFTGSTLEGAMQRFGLAAFWTSARRPYNALRKYAFDVLHFVFVHSHLLRARGEYPAAETTRYLCVRESNHAFGVRFSRISRRYR